MAWFHQCIKPDLFPEALFALLSLHWSKMVHECTSWLNHTYRPVDGLPELKSLSYFNSLNLQSASPACLLIHDKCPYFLKWRRQDLIQHKLFFWNVIFAYSNKISTVLFGIKLCQVNCPFSNWFARLNPRDDIEFSICSLGSWLKAPLRWTTGGPMSQW